MQLSLQDVANAAATVGRGSPGSPRFYGPPEQLMKDRTYQAMSALGIRWRATMVRDVLDFDSPGVTLTPEFRTLDASEKVFIGYYLGMFQTARMVAKLADIHHLVHFDALAKQPVSSRARPDLVGVRSDPRDASIYFVEAKHRCAGSRSTAKKVAQQAIESQLREKKKEGFDELFDLLGRPAGFARAVGLVNVSYFDRSDQERWCAYLADPPVPLSGANDDSERRDQTLGDVFAAYYAPLVCAMTYLGATSDSSVGGRAAAEFADADVVISCALPVFDAMVRLSDESEEPERAKRELTAVVRDQPGDGIAVELGGTWDRLRDSHGPV